MNCLPGSVQAPRLCLFARRLAIRFFHSRKFCAVLSGARKQCPWFVSLGSPFELRIVALLAVPEAIFEICETKRPECFLRRYWLTKEFFKNL